MNQRLFGLALAVALACPSLAAAQAARALTVNEKTTERRVALVVGNNAYAEGPLQNAARDAKAIDKALRDSGFEVSVLLDANMKDMEHAIDRRREPSRRRRGVFYYSGHGIRIQRELSVPVDFHALDEADAGIRFRDSSSIVSAAPPRASTSSFACRNNPFHSTRSGFEAWR